MKAVHMSHYLKAFLIVLFWSTFFLRPLVVVAADKVHKPILIICSYNPAAHQTSVTISDFMDEYQKLGGKHNIEIENMNCKSFSESFQWRGVMSKILSKYQGDNEPSQIILLGQEAWAAYLSQNDSVARTVPVMCSLTSRNSVILPTDTTILKNWTPQSVDFFSDADEHKEVRTGFLYEYDIAANIRLIQHFYPDTKHIAFLSDNTYGGVTMQALVREKMSEFPELELIQLDGRSNTIYTIVDKFRALPPHTAVLLGTWRVDMNEGYFMRNATYAMMEANPGIPAFSLSSVGLGYWAAGGVIPAYRELGRDMARESIRMNLHPEDTTNHVALIGSRAVLDYHKAKELKLDPSSLPFEVELANRPISFYEQYTLQIWGVSLILVILVGGLCISLYFYCRAKKLAGALRRSSQDLLVAKDHAEESNRLKSAFLANMSHEIRTPLNAIVGFSDVLVAGGYSKEEQRGYFDIIQSNSDLLLRLINDILDVSRLESDRVVFSFEQCESVQLCHQILASMMYSRKTNSNTFQFDSRYSTYLMRADVQRLQQVIINLLSNAAKFTKAGTITLAFDVDEAANMAIFSVTDTGCGIPKEKQERIFERFEKLNEYAQGTGLGLAICQLTTEKWGGRIWVDPNYTQGARFVFTHPLNINE